jgi:hypothetical protein
MTKANRGDKKPAHNKMNMIDIIPYRTSKFHTSLEGKEIIRRLDKLTDKYHDIIGYVEPEKFIFERKINYQNPFKPTVRGQIINNGVNKQIILNFRPGTGVLIFYLGFIVVFILGSLNFWGLKLFPKGQFIGLAFFVFTLLMTGFNIERRKLEVRIKKEFE